MSPQGLRNRLVLATGVWKRLTNEPLPRLKPADPAAQVEEFEMLLIERASEIATPDNAREIAEATWDLVHDRADADAVKQRVTKLHEDLAKLTHGGAGG